MPSLPSGTVTFLFTDIEGSTPLWEQHPDAMSRAVSRHHTILRESIEAHGGHVFNIAGDAFCAAFATASDGLAAALDAQRTIHQAGPERLPDWVARLPAQPTVYVTLGTEVNKEPELYPSVLQTIISGLRDLAVNLIVTLGRDKDPADFGPQPANVHIERYIPQSLLLRECDLMVMHGGSNSLLAALDTGLPMVVAPLIADQFFNAHVTQNIGLGQVVQREQLTPANIRAAVEEVLSNPMYRKTAGRLQAEMHALPGQENAVGLVEGVAMARIETAV